MSTDPADFCVKQHAVPGIAKDPDKAARLFRPLTIHDVTFANYAFVSPMCVYPSQETDYHLVHMGRFALRGVGLGMVEATAVAPEGRISPQSGIQLAHAGRKASTYPLFEKDGRSLIPEDESGCASDVLAPSPIRTWASDMATPNEMTVEQIQATVAAFAAAAERADRAGFDMLEIQGTHGYLVHQFLSPVSDQRTDGYGGALENQQIRHSHLFQVPYADKIKQAVPEVHTIAFLRDSWVVRSAKALDTKIGFINQYLYGAH
ncbi:hypothetical protein GGF32_001660 [Allomyces javanicus]|nr:hypothetical protein GGF32_001660 [Allomyces javanicus]